MKKILLFSSIYCLILCGSVFGDPLFSISKSEHDFGTIKQQTTVKENIVFKNQGNSDLVIEKIETTCGCTGTKVDKEKLKPNEEGILEVSFNSGTYDGKITRTIYIHTNDPKNKMYAFKIVVNVIK